MNFWRKRYIFLFGAVFLFGCDNPHLSTPTQPAASALTQLANSISPEAEFLESMQGRWSLNKKTAYSFARFENKLIGISNQGEAVVMTPTGKFDEGNEILPIKVAAYGPANEYAIWEKMAEVACPSCFDAWGKMTVVTMLKNSDPKLFHQKGFENGIENFIAALNKLKNEMKNDIPINCLLYNADQTKNSIRIAIKDDSGNPLMEFGFVRQLNEEEIKAISSMNSKIDEIITKRNQLIDDVIDLEIKKLEVQDGKIKAEEEAKKAEALEYIRSLTSAAEQGDALGQYNLGAYYQNIDYVKSLMWLKIAADADNKDSKLKNEILKTLDSVSRRAMEEQRVKARELAEQCSEKNFKGC